MHNVRIPCWLWFIGSVICLGLCSGNVMADDDPDENDVQKILNLIDPMVVNSWGWRLQQWNYAAHDPNNPLGTNAYANIQQHAQGMRELYHSKATLLPTLGFWRLYLNEPPSPNPDAPVIYNYFRFKFLPKEPTLEEFKRPGVPDDPHVVFSADKTMAAAQGLYWFSFHGIQNVDGKARFTFVFKKFNDEWMIVQHHSSGVPNLNHPADLNKDGEVNWLDLLELLDAWGPQPPPPETCPVPGFPNHLCLPLQQHDCVDEPGFCLPLVIRLDPGDQGGLVPVALKCACSDVGRDGAPLFCGPFFFPDPRIVNCLGACPPDLVCALIITHADGSQTPIPGEANFNINKFGEPGDILQCLCVPPF